MIWTFLIFKYKDFSFHLYYFLKIDFISEGDKTAHNQVRGCIANKQN